MAMALNIFRYRSCISVQVPDTADKWEVPGSAPGEEPLRLVRRAGKKRCDGECAKTAGGDIFCIQVSQDILRVGIFNHTISGIGWRRGQFRAGRERLPDGIGPEDP